MKVKAIAALLATLLAAPAGAQQLSGDRAWDAGIRAYDEGDYETALGYFMTAAEQGRASARNNLGVMYANGLGVPKDYAEAVTWFRLAAEQGDADAQVNFGLTYLIGQGVPRDHAMAAQWFRRAAEQGDPDAQINLGILYADGRGVARDYVMAHMWSNLAAASLPAGEDRDLAVRNRDLAAGRMTSWQVAEAQRLASAWKPSREAAGRGDLPRTRPVAASARQVREVQGRLAALGYDPGPADGVAGPRTRGAIRAFQADHGLPVTGEPSAALRAAVAEQRLRDLLSSKTASPGG